ncbi:MAG TPA: ABC transporter permease [Clostridiales bacterium]|nr:ABC transporter permease [Clostridiales bacterium]
MKKSGSIENKLIPISFFTILIFIWELVARLELVPAYILPGPIRIIKTLFMNLPVLKEHIIVTSLEAIAGFVISAIFAIAICLLMDSITIVKKAIYPLIIVSQTIPIITIAPLFAIWFGFGYLPKVVIVVLVCFFPITISLLEGLSSVDEDLLNLIKSMGANKIQTYKMVKLPAAMPSFFSGLKIAGTYSIMGATIGEWVGGKRGLGVYMLRVKHSFATDKVFATIIVITLLSILLLKVIGIIERKSMPWIYKQELENTEEYK